MPAVAVASEGEGSHRHPLVPRVWGPEARLSGPLVVFFLSLSTFGSPHSSLGMLWEDEQRNLNSTVWLLRRRFN